MSFDPQSPTVPPTTLPSPLQHAAQAPDTDADARPSPPRMTQMRRTLAWQATAALGLDAAILVAMLALAWQLFLPWSGALDAADGLMAIGLVACGGLWTAFVEQDVRRWRRLRRSVRHPVRR